MAVFVVCVLLFLAMTGHSSGATYCICKDGLSDSVLQKSIDYACGNGADCTLIQQNGACFNPNTVKDHCNYAVNSYFQKKGQTSGSCDFSGSATTSQSAPSSQTTTCVYPTSASGTTPSTTPPSSTTPTTTPPPGTPSTTTPIATPPPGTPSTTTPTPPSSTTPSTTPSTNTPSVFGLAPTGTGGITSTDSSGSRETLNLFCSLALTLLLSGLVFLRI